MGFHKFLPAITLLYLFSWVFIDFCLPQWIAMCFLRFSLVLICHNSFLIFVRGFHSFLRRHSWGFFLLGAFPFPTHVSADSLGLCMFSWAVRSSCGRCAEHHIFLRFSIAGHNYKRNSCHKLLVYSVLMFALDSHRVSVLFYSLRVDSKEVLCVFFWFPDIFHILSFSEKWVFRVLIFQFGSP